MINQLYALKSIKMQKDIQPNWPNKLCLLKIYYLAMQEHLFGESKCEILSLHDRTILPTHVAYQNTGFLCFLNSLFILSIVCQFLLLVLLDNQPTCVAPALLLYQIERSFQGLLGQRKTTFLDSIKCKGATVLDFCSKENLFSCCFWILSFLALLRNQLPEFHKFTQIVSPSLKNKTSFKQPRLIK